MPSEREPLLACRGLGRLPWIRDFDLDLLPGEIVVVRGPSGSGKTLLLRALADLDPIDAGRVTLAKRLREEYTPAEWRRRVLYVHQTPAFVASTVQAEFERIRRLLPDGGPGTYSSDAKRVGLAPDASTMHLSGGEALRLALGRALLIAPDVLLLDEITAALDQDAARVAEGLVLEHVQSGLPPGGQSRGQSRGLRRAALWVSHDETLSARLGAREVWIQ